MRLLSYIIISVCIGNALFAQNNYKINVKINGIKDTVCYLAYYYGDKQYLKDTVRVNAKSEMVFTGDKPLDGGIYLIVTPDKNFFEVIVDKQQIFSIETDTSDFIKKTIFKNSSDNTLFYKYLNFIQDKNTQITPLKIAFGKTTNPDSTELLKNQIQKINEEVQAYKTTYMQQNQNTLLAQIFKASEEVEIPEPPVLATGGIDSSFQFKYFKEHYWDNINLSDDRILRTPIFHQKLDFYMKKLMHPLPDSIIVEVDNLIAKTNGNQEMFKYLVWLITNEYAQSKIMGYDAIYVHMVKTYYMTGKAFWVTESQLKAITERAMKVEPILIGKETPDITYLTTPQGQVVGLHQLINTVKPKFTILAFWSPDCGHCKTEIPHLHKVYEKYKDKGVMAFVVPTMRDTAQVMEFIKKHKLTDWINALDILHASNFRADYDIYATPVVFVLDENKKIIAKKLGPEQIDEMLERFLDEKHPANRRKE